MTTDDLPLWSMSRRTDPATSKTSAAVVKPTAGKIQALVLAVFRRYGAMTARDAEWLDEFDGYSPNTVRKRISELAKAGLLEECGVDREGRAPATVYRVAEGGSE